MNLQEGNEGICNADVLEIRDGTDGCIGISINLCDIKLPDKPDSNPGRPNLLHVRWPLPSTCLTVHPQQFD